MRVSVGVIGEVPIAIHASARHVATAVNFAIREHPRHPNELSVAPGATPGSVLAEMLRRLQRHAPADQHLVVNPRHRASARTVEVLLASALCEAPEAQALVIADRHGLTAGIAVREHVDERELTAVALLEALDAARDATLLERHFGWRTACARNARIRLGRRSAIWTE